MTGEDYDPCMTRYYLICWLVVVAGFSFVVYGGAGC